jgi:outer membrane protein OmpA-like peptidoglycan-associated protein
LWTVKQLINKPNKRKEFIMKKFKNCKIMAVLIALCVVFSGCNNKTGNGALIGAGGGAALGTVIGAIAGNAGVGALIGGAVGAGTGAVIGHRMDKIKKEAQANLDNAKVETVKDANGLDAVKISFNSGILFATNKYDLNNNSKNDLNDLANIMRQNSDVSIDVKGYTDSTGTDAINQPLSLNRAQAVANYLTQNGVAYSQLKNVNGYGSSNPVADNSTEAGRQQNRRVEVYMYASQEMIKNAQKQQ